MRVLVAGLFVYVGIMMFIAFTADSSWINGLPAYVFGTISVAFISALVYVAHRLFQSRKFLQKSLRYALPTPGDQRQPAWKFQFESSARELLRADRAERRERSGMNAFFRGIVIFMGFVWILLPFAVTGPDIELWRPVLSVLLGLLVLRSFLMKPMLTHWRIRRNTPRHQSVNMRVEPSGVSISTNSRVEHRPWEELSSVLPTPDGIVFYWEDGTKSWLPAPAIGTDDDIQALLVFIEDQLGKVEDP